MKEFVETIIDSESFRSRKYFDWESVRHEFDLHVAGNKNASMKIWQCVFLEMWMREFIDGNTMV